MINKELSTMKKRNYPIKPTKKQREIIGKYIKEFCALNNVYYNTISDIEKKMREETKIEGLEFIHDTMCMGWIGVGTFPPDMEIITLEEYM
jgi:hypothetical protein